MKGITDEQAKFLGEVFDKRIKEFKKEYEKLFAEPQNAEYKLSAESFKSITENMEQENLIEDKTPYFRKFEKKKF